MSELARRSSALETYTLGDRSLLDWHDYLTTDVETGEPTGHLAVPSSRYGRIADETAWWAIAAQGAFTYASGVDSTNQEFLDYFMGLTVNDDPSVYGLVKEFKSVMPTELIDQLD